MNNLTTPLTTANLLSTTHRQSHTTAAKQRSTSPRINAQIKVEVSTVLIGATETVLGTQRVALRRAQVGHLDDNGVAKGLLVARGVSAGSQFPAGSTGGAGACAGADTEFVLGYCG